MTTRPSNSSYLPLSWRTAQRQELIDGHACRQDDVHGVDNSMDRIAANVGSSSTAPISDWAIGECDFALIAPYATARSTLAMRSRMSAMSASVEISGGATIRVSMVTRT